MALPASLARFRGTRTMEGENDLSRMEPPGAGYIQPRVGVMHPVETPKQRDSMVCAVPPVNSEVQQQNRRAGVQPQENAGPVQQPKARAR